MSDIKLLIVLIDIWSLRWVVICIVLNVQDFLPLNNLGVNKFVSDSVVSFLAQIVPLFVQKDRGFFDGDSYSIVVAFAVCVDFEVQTDGSSQLLPELIVVFELRKINSVDDLSEIGLITDFELFLHVFHIRFVEVDAIRIAVFEKVEDFGAYQHDWFVPFALDLVGFLVVNRCEDLRGGQNSIGKAKTGIEIMPFSQF